MKKMRARKVGRVEAAVPDLQQSLESFSVGIDQRFGAIDQRFDAVDRRFDAVDREFALVRQEICDGDEALKTHLTVLIDAVRDDVRIFAGPTSPSKRRVVRLEQRHR